MLLEDKPIILPPAGTHTAILYSIIDLGTQRTEFKGEAKNLRKAIFRFELSDEFMDDGRPFSIAKKYTLSLSEKAALIADLKSWTGQPIKSGFYINQLLSKAGNITIVHDSTDNGKTYANITAITPLKKSDKPPKQVNESFIFDLSEFDQNAFDTLPDYYKTVVTLSPEYQAIVNGTAKAPVKQSKADLDDEIPL